jgi:glutaredoxin-like protein NrdH
LTVTVYTKPGCPQCDATIRHLGKLKLEHPDIEWKKVNLAEQPHAVKTVTDLGYSQVPVVVVGEDHWSGFRPDRIDALAG